MPNGDWPADLTDREIDVIRLAARGHSNRQMANEWFVSEDTVKTHLRHTPQRSRQFAACRTCRLGSPFAIGVGVRDWEPGLAYWYVLPPSISRICPVI
ncbi:MAG TPA: helix-turn-helix transcriptional regulator [Candidatus Dormibacteraeota bacterium]|nr:helix-turn-helix transcriptional regulator [Candidatus Dormibacteraeota bacterium]